MSLVQVVVLAILQGFTEFLPISSSAHLALAPWLFGWPDQGLSFDIALHVGTLAAVLLYFSRDWMQLIALGFGFRHGSDEQLHQNRNLLWLLTIGSLPVGVIGLAVKDYAETTWRNPLLIGTMLISVGLLIAAAERIARRRKHIGQVTLADSLVIGFAQALALVPGTSRSGITITAGLLRGLDHHAAARFSFLLSTPAIAAAAAKDFYDLWKGGGIPPSMYVPFVMGIVVSGITGALVIRFFLAYLRTRGLMFFVYYRVIFGIIVIALAIFFRYPGR
ncbi:MAG: undecaprenyl-diphosphate phosphatase [Bryobacteraceae bacterium]|nr:undecaprenyl-diphosphate phosphatase [Bryobacteraceae bacterium]